MVGAKNASLGELIRNLRSLGVEESKIMKIDSRDFFEQLGNLFYAIAAEQHVKPLEAGELKLLISRDWLPRSLGQNRSVVSDETHFILMTMDTLQAAETSARAAYNQFAKFYSLHPEIFTTELTERILQTAIEITAVFKADNPSDNTHLVALRKLMKGAKVKAS